MCCNRNIIFLMISIVSSEMRKQEDVKSSPDIEREDEWHMDFVPTGYLPDSVYRELAWYGVLQVQPLYRSAKHKVAARWLWQNTLGRPHLITEAPPQSAQNEDTVSHQAIAEESAKWSRERRMAQDVLMDNIRTGGNGLTVRTVVSSTKKSVYIIQNGVYFECASGSEPDVEAFRSQANMHERKCTFGKQAEPRAIDPCIDAEAAPLEFSYLYGWMFCLGDGERETTHLPNGDLDCGNKIKMRYSDFLRECAVDGNVVITFEYFGDEPRKDMVHNTTLCTAWDPCRVSYLYRIEISEKEPELSPPTTDSCDTTVCPACLNGGTEETVNPDPAKDTDLLHVTVDKPVQWIPANTQNISTILNKALVAGFLGNGQNLYLIRASYGTTVMPGFYDDNLNLGFTAWDTSTIPVTSFEVAIPTAELEWRPGGHSCEHMVFTGSGYQGYTCYVCRMTWEHDFKPGKYYKEYDACYIAHDGTQVNKTAQEGFETLCVL